MSDSHFRSLVRNFKAMPTDENAMKLAIVVARSEPSVHVRTRPLTTEEILAMPVSNENTVYIEGFVRINFNDLWSDSSGGSMLPGYDYNDAISEALIGTAYLQDLDAEIVDVEPGEVLIIRAAGYLDLDDL